MQGLTEEQISDLKLHDSWADKCVPSGGAREVKDPMSKRNGQGKDSSKFSQPPPPSPTIDLDCIN